MRNGMYNVLRLLPVMYFNPTCLPNARCPSSFVCAWSCRLCRGNAARTGVAGYGCPRPENSASRRKPAQLRPGTIVQQGTKPATNPGNTFEIRNRAGVSDRIGFLDTLGYAQQGSPNLGSFACAYLPVIFRRHETLRLYETEYRL